MGINGLKIPCHIVYVHQTKCLILHEIIQYSIASERLLNNMFDIILGCK